MPPSRGLWLAASLATAALGGCVAANPAAVETGTVLAAVPVNQAGENTGTGAVMGMVVLGAAGGAVGQGAGKALAVAAGVVAGSAAGAAAEAAGQQRDGMAYTIKLADGRVVTIIEHVADGDKIFAAGDPVELETTGDHQIIVPAGS